MQPARDPVELRSASRQAPLPSATPRPPQSLSQIAHEQSAEPEEALLQLRPDTEPLNLFGLPNSLLGGPPPAPFVFLSRRCSFC
jgi:hypothetical protein